MSEIIVPGDLIYKEPKRFEGSFVDNGSTYASVVSVKYDDRVVALKGKYRPIIGDYIVGIISEVKFNCFVVDLNSPYVGEISSRETREPFQVGDIVSAAITDVDEVNEAMLVEPRKMWGGRLLEIEAVKIPRVIGKNSSMLAMIEDGTQCRIFVGKNGRLYLKGGNLALAEMCILKISKEAHLHGLTDRIKNFIDEEKAKNGVQ